MTPPLAVVEKRRDLLTAIASTALSATIHALPADFLAWAVALKAREYSAWRHPDKTVSVIVAGDVGGRPVRVHAVFTGPPPFMPRTIAAALPDFDGPEPAGRYPFPEAA